MTATYIPPPSPRDLLPPLLACLSTATSSKQVPPGLIPLLSPILRQRIQLLASDIWLPLLCWDSQIGSKLQDIVGRISIEPHPVSGEIEVEEPESILYRRSDPETLHARLTLRDFDLLPTYLWCTGGEGGDGWKLSELRGLEYIEDGTEWFKSMAEANEAGFRRKPTATNGTSSLVTTQTTSQPSSASQKEEDEDDDDYWAAYDRTPGRTPQAKRSPAPMLNSRVQLPSQSELEYFARYAAEVQPALDAHDPDEPAPAPGESTLNGDSLNLEAQTRRQPEQHLEQFPSPEFSPESNGIHAIDNHTYTRRDSPTNLNEKPEHIEMLEESYAALNHPRASSPASSVEILEREAERSSNAELAIKQHISTDLKSLFRLARTAGIDREEFERIVKRELEVLPMLEMDE